MPFDAVSGIYLAKPTRPDNGDTSHIVFVVRNDLRAADVLVQTSDTTWQAYNRYGGASLYCADAGGVSNAGSAYANSCDRRASKVSYNRPFDTRRHSPQSFLFNAEYPMVRFLEANGYDVKYWAGVDTDRRGRRSHRRRQAEGVRVVRPRRVLVRRTARRRRSGARRGRQPRVFQRQRSVLEDALRAEHGERR